MNAWLNHRSVERSKHAKYVLQRVRLSLLSVPALKSILDKNLWITENDECSEVVKKVIDNKNKFPLNCTNILPSSRHCSQENFKFVVVGGRIENTRIVVRDAFTLDGSDFSNVNSLPTINYGRYRSTIVCIKGEIYVFGGMYMHDPVMPVEKYSPDTNAWNVIGQMHDDRLFSCACSFIDSVYVLGGLLKGYTNSCLVFNTTNKTWKEIARMNESKCGASCVVFEGRIVVTGGNSNNVKMNTVKAYDHIDDSWNKMPNMIKERNDHKSVAIKNKLYIVGGLYETSIEVFDSCTNKFVFIKYNSRDLTYKYISDITTLGNRILIFKNNNGLVLVYDVEKDEWVEKVSNATAHITYFSCAKIPKH